ncbi:MAG: hypothetical protein C0597_08165 [Marinilabiliales bacterium]|nr:MAG: hypothetical protein C0597_08165 [Marinilabiliales bacterium]
MPINYLKMQSEFDSLLHLTIKKKQRMYIIADSGSTKTDWVLIENKKISTSFTTKGFNPYFTTTEQLYKDLIHELPNDLNPIHIKQVFFYGSGCSLPEMKNLIYHGLKKIFSRSEIEINHDLLAAARALFKNESGIALILGTGANTCLYNGNKIVHNIPSLGFILGDEGGGDYLGKLFITELLYHNLPKDISSKFLKKFDLSADNILQKLYKEDHPNQFLASICEFIFEKKENNVIQDIIYKSFNDLFNTHIIKYKNYHQYKIRATGSIAYYFKDYLNKVASEFNTSIDLVVRAPIFKLADYHLK